eukprot:8609996-Lingulodinium_polyedra.AAC.1
MSEHHMIYEIPVDNPSGLQRALGATATSHNVNAQPGYSGPWGQPPATVARYQRQRGKCDG